MYRKKTHTYHTDVTDCVYLMPCKSCNHAYIGETENIWNKTRGTQEGGWEHHNHPISGNKRQSATVEHKSAITDHADRNNCVIGWEGADVTYRERERESNRNAKWINKAIWIRKTTPTMMRGNTDLVSRFGPRYISLNKLWLRTATNIYAHIHRLVK